jgi:hypothetical protein
VGTASAAVTKNECSASVQAVSKNYKTKKKQSSKARGRRVNKPRRAMVSIQSVVRQWSQAPEPCAWRGCVAPDPPTDLPGGRCSHTYGPVRIVWTSWTHWIQKHADVKDTKDVSEDCGDDSSRWIPYAHVSLGCRFSSDDSAHRGPTYPKGSCSAQILHYR